MHMPSYQIERIT